MDNIILVPFNEQILKDIAPHIRNYGKEVAKKILLGLGYKESVAVVLIKRALKYV
jgi:hypothetical protein